MNFWLIFIQTLPTISLPQELTTNLNLTSETPTETEQVSYIETITEIDSDKIGFADMLFDLLGNDLRRVGLTLNNIAISEIEESDDYNINDYFDAQGLKVRTETIQGSIQQALRTILKTPHDVEKAKVALDEIDQYFKTHH